jgi:hypothetical protein
MGMARPLGLKYRTPEALQAAIDRYFDDCDKRTRKIVNRDGDVESVPDPRPYTLQGMGVSLDLYDTHWPEIYSNRNVGYAQAISRARAKILAQRVENLVHCDTRNTNGIKFDLTNNFGWKEKSEVEHSGSLAVPPAQLTVRLIRPGDKE